MTTDTDNIPLIDLKNLTLQLHNLGKSVEIIRTGEIQGLLNAE